MNSKSQVPEELTVPSELTGNLPRRTIATQEGAYAKVLSLILMALAVCSFLWVGKDTAQQLKQREALRAEGIETIGRITKISGRRGLIVQYSFIANGASYKGEAPVPNSLEGRLAKAIFITVRYLPKNPAVNHPAQWGWSVASALSLLVGPVIFLVPAPMIVLRLLLRERRILAFGLPAVATLTESSPGKTRSSIRYEFRSSDGWKIKGKGSCDGLREVGTKIWILYLPDEPSLNQPYPSTSYVVAE